MYYLSREDIEKMAERIISTYTSKVYPKGYLYYYVDPTELAAQHGFRIVYECITRDGSILGETSNGAIWTTIIDANLDEVFFYLDGKTILVEKRLLLNRRSIGRRNFTIAHELAHQFINRAYPEVYGAQCRNFCDYRRSAKTHKQITDWREWQADALAAALLLPREAIEDCMFFFGLGEKMKVLSKKYSEYKYNRFCEMADFLQVSRTTLSYRMEQLGLLERNCLIEEAQARKGAYAYGNSIPNR